MTAKTYVATWEKLVTWAAGNGLSPDGFGRLSNGQVVALTQAWRRAAARAPAAAKGFDWQTINANALGRFLGEKFDMSESHAKAEYPAGPLVSTGPAMPLSYFWETTGALAESLDAAQTVVRPLYIDNTMAAYQQGARDTWEEIKRGLDRVRRDPVPGIPDECKEDPSRCLPHPGRPPTVGWPWLLLAGVVVVKMLD